MKMKNSVLSKIHWLGFTVHAEKRASQHLYNQVFKDYLGELSDLGHGGSGYRSIQRSALEFKLYTSPITAEQEHFHFDIPGSACDAILPTMFLGLVRYLEQHYSEAYNFTRLDLAFDHLEFAPQDVEEALVSGLVRTLAKRESIRSFKSPFQPKDNGETGTYTVELGANRSERMITVYNKRGYTRLEFQTRGDRADAVAKDLLSSPDVNDWFALMLAHLLDFVDFETDWWTAFKTSQGRANTKVSSAKQITAERLITWIDGQVAPALSALEDAYPDKLIPKLIERGRKRRGNKYDALFLEDNPGEDKNNE